MTNNTYDSKLLSPSTFDYAIYGPYSFLVEGHRSFLSKFLFRHGLKSELEEISQKINFLLKGAVSEQFLKAFWNSKVQYFF